MNSPNIFKNKRKQQTKISSLFYKRKKTSSSRSSPSKVSAKSDVVNTDGHTPLQPLPSFYPAIRCRSAEDVQKAIEYLHKNMFDKQQVFTKQADTLVVACPAVVVESQLSGLFQNDFTTVSQNLSLLLKKGSLKKLYIKRSDNFPGEACLIKTSTFEGYLDKIAQTLVEDEEKKVIQSFQEASKEFQGCTFPIQNLPFSDQERRILIKLGLLILAGPSTYGVSLPTIGVFTQMLQYSRQDIVRYLKKRPYGEALECDIVQRNTTASFKGKNTPTFSWEFRICDAIGCGIVDAFMTNCGKALRLTQKGRSF
ncbi:fungal protein [Schizosaccharomyces japonicus yFS275]|uniref:Fungal protein n=1 Tax=Schizosaccharomyces japonicus (strain yFS275 / FY16936) TaxID=402676 RepID=B6JVC2_SCHJY|nr:fungal protein [Schizosaccharomyces japonicus yFS275]EEB05323.1 fungal protein [Schizosaccharomyces japonicus yFS275]